jgi:serine/threonine protein kinase
MPDLASHPAADLIEAFALGKLSPAENLPLEEHLAACELCQERADAVGSDTLVELLASAGTRADADLSAAPTPTLTGFATPSLLGTMPAPDEDTGAPAALLGHPKYRTVRLLGSGGMGTVWLAEHAVMNRPVAVKVIRPDLLSRPGAVERFLREVRAAAKLHHPNIVTAFDAETVGDSCLLVMEYVPGETLADRTAGGPLPVAEACRAVCDAARGLAHAHAAGLVHRDVKPHNLIRAADGTVKVLDFGLAGVEVDIGSAERRPIDGGLTEAGVVVGTPDYIAPEQILDSRSADARADIYALGCTLYHLLTGRPPFPDGSALDKLAAHQTDTPDPIPALPPDMADVLAKMMAKRPEDRFGSADDVIAALEPYLNEESGERATGAKTNQGRARKWAVLAGGLLLAGLLALAGVIFKIQYDNQEFVIQTSDPHIEIVMKRKGEVVRVVDRKSGQVWNIDAAANEIGLADQEDGLKLSMPENQAIVLRRHGKDVFTVRRISKRNTEPPGETLPSPLPDPPSGAKATDGWTPLFNGKDLTGWKAGGGTPATWKVDNGILRGAGSPGFLVSEKSYGEFHLRAQVRINPGARWRLLFHTDPSSLEKNQKPQGYGAEFVYRGQTRDVEGRLYMAIQFTKDGVPLATHVYNVKPNDWFPVDVFVQNGEVNIITPGGGLGSKLTPALPPGPIILGLPDENSAIEFLKIDIKELSPAAAPAKPGKPKTVYGYLLPDFWGIERDVPQTDQQSLPEKAGLIRALPLATRRFDLGDPLSPDGRLVLCAVDHKPDFPDCVRVVEVATGRFVRDLGREGEWLSGMMFLPDGKRVLTCVQFPEAGYGFRLWDIESRREIPLDRLKPTPERPTLFHASADGKRLAMTMRNPDGITRARVLDLETGAELLSIPAPKNKSEWLMRTRLSADGKQAVTASTWRETNQAGDWSRVRVDALDGSGKQREVELAYYANNPYFVDGSGKIGMFVLERHGRFHAEHRDVAGKQTLWQYLGDWKSRWVFPEETGRRAAVLMGDDRLEVFDARAGWPVFSTEPLPAYTACSLSPDGRVLAVQTKTELRLYRLPDPQAAPNP